MGASRGSDWKLYVSATLLTATSDVVIDALAWTEVTRAQDTSDTNENEEITFRTKENNGDEQSCAGGRTSSADIQIAYEKSDAGYGILLTAFEAKSEIAYALVDGDITTATTHGSVGNVTVLTFSRSQPISDITQADVTVKPSSTIFDMNYTHA